MHDIVNNIAVMQVLAPQTIQAAALNSGAIDTQGRETLAVAVLVGAVGDTLDSSNRIDLKIEHADDDGTGSPAAFAACTADDVLNADTVTDGIFFSVDDDDKKTPVMSSVIAAASVLSKSPQRPYRCPPAARLP